MPTPFSNTKPNSSILLQCRSRIQLEKEKKILSFYKSYKEKLPQLIFQEIKDLNCDWSVLEKAIFKAKIPGYYEVYLKVFPNQKDFQPIRENLGLRSEFCAVFRMIERAERIMKKNNYWVHLTVYKDGSYVYNDDYIPEVNKKA